MNPDRCYLCRNHSRDRILNELPVGKDGKAYGKVLLCGDCWTAVRNQDYAISSKLWAKARRDFGVTKANKSIIIMPGEQK